MSEDSTNCYGADVKELKARVNALNVLRRMVHALRAEAYGDRLSESSFDSLDRDQVEACMATVAYAMARLKRAGVMTNATVARSEIFAIRKIVTASLDETRVAEVVERGRAKAREFALDPRQPSDRRWITAYSALRAICFQMHAESAGVSLAPEHQLVLAELEIIERRYGTLNAAHQALTKVLALCKELKTSPGEWPEWRQLDSIRAIGALTVRDFSGADFIPPLSRVEAIV